MGTAVGRVNATESFRKIGSTDDGRYMAGFLARVMGMGYDPSPSQRQGGLFLLNEVDAPGTLKMAKVELSRRHCQRIFRVNQLEQPPDLLIRDHPRLLSARSP